MFFARQPRQSRGDRGQASFEYVGVLVAVAAVVGVVAAVPIVPVVGPATRSAVCRVLQQSDCGESDPVVALAKLPVEPVVTDPETATVIPFVSHRNVAPQLVCGRNGCTDITVPRFRPGFGHGPVVHPDPVSKIEPRAKANDKCAKGKGKATNQGSSSSTHTTPAWNVDWTIDPYGYDLRSGWTAMIEQVRARATAGQTHPLNSPDATAVGTVTIHTNDGRRVTLFMQANDLYIIGWQTTRQDGTPGPTYQVNEPGTNHDLAALLCPGAQTVPLTSNYNSLIQSAGNDAARVAINRQSLSNAVQGLANFDPSRNNQRGAAAGLLTMATTIAEAARFPQVERSVGAMIENYPNSFGNHMLGPGDQDLITNWGDLSDLAEGRRTTRPILALAVLRQRDGCLPFPGCLKLDP